MTKIIRRTYNPFNVFNPTSEMLSVRDLMNRVRVRASHESVAHESDAQFARRAWRWLGGGDGCDRLLRGRRN